MDSAATINSSRGGHGKAPRCLYRTIRTKIRTSQSQWFARGEDCPPPLLRPPRSLHTELHPAKTDSLISVVEVYYYIEGRTKLSYQNQPHERNRRKSKLAIQVGWTHRLRLVISKVVNVMNGYFRL